MVKEGLLVPTRPAYLSHDINQTFLENTKLKKVPATSRSSHILGNASQKGKANKCVLACQQSLTPSTSCSALDKHSIKEHSTDVCPTDTVLPVYCTYYPEAVIKFLQTSPYNLVYNKALRLEFAYTMTTTVHPSVEKPITLQFIN